MLKLIVLSMLSAVAVAAPAPGLLGAASLVGAPIHSIAPSITSSSSSVVHSTALVHAASALGIPALHGGVLAAPALHGGVLAAPALHGGLLAAPSAVLSAPALGDLSGLSAHGLLGAPLAFGVHGIH